MRNLMTAACVCALAAAAHADFLLLMDSGNDRVLALDPMDGSLINPSVVADPARWGTVTSVIDSTVGTLLIADQSNDAIYEYSYGGDYLRTIADNTDGIDNIRHIAVRDGVLYAAVASGPLEESVLSMTLDGDNVQQFANPIASPWYIHFRDNDMLVTNSSGDTIERFDLAGNSLGPIHDSDGLTGIDFPRQIFEKDNGNLLVGGFSTPAGIYEYDALGNQLDYTEVNPGQLGLRGLWQLGNGNLVYSGGTRAGILDPNTDMATDFAFSGSGNSFQYFGVSPLPEPTTAVLVIAGLTLAIRRR